MIDSTYVKDHQNSSGSRGWNQAISKDKREFNSKIHIGCK